MAKKYQKKLVSHGCMYCRFTCFKPEALGEHFRKEHRDQTMAGAYRPARKAEDGRWECQLCTEKFITLEGLEHHCTTEHTDKLL